MSTSNFDKAVDEVVLRKLENLYASQSKAEIREILELQIKAFLRDGGEITKIS